MSIFEYDEEKELKLLREAEREYGVEIGRDEESIKNIRKLIEKLIITPE